MRQKATVGGRSYFFNALFVVFNLIGLSFVILGSHKNFENYFVLFSFIGYLLIALSAGGLLIFQGRLMMANVSRILVGSLFIVSGLIKANDPLGFSYKLAEYFEDGALAYRIKELFGAPGFSLEFLIDNAFFLSVLICLIEIVLGVLTIIGGKIKLVSYLLMLMMIFFTFLTWHTANCDSTKKFIDRDTYQMSSHLASVKIQASKKNKDIKIVSKSSEELVVEEMKSPQCVEDCGCFGDAMKGSVGRSLSPKESMWKDLVLLYLVFWIFVAQWIIEPNDKKRNIQFLILSTILIGFFSWVFSWYFLVVFALILLISALWMRKSGGIILGNFFGASISVFSLSGIFIIYVSLYEPMKDYRPYAVGSHLEWKMKDGVVGKYESILIYKNNKTGERIEYLSTSREYIDSKIWEDKNWSYLEMDQKEIIATKLPSITDQFNPFITIDELGKEELKLDFVKEELSKASVKTLEIKKIGESNSSKFSIPFSEFNTTDYPTEEFEVLDTFIARDPSVSEISIKDLILKADKIFVLSVKNLSEANWNAVERYKSIFSECKKNKIPFVMICNGTRQEIQTFRKEFSFNLPVFINDETELKAIARSNPSLMIIEKGVVIGKYPHRSTPSYSWIKRNIF